MDQRSLNDIMRDPRPDPGRKFALAIDKLQEKPLERAVRRFNEGARNFTEALKALGGVIDQPIETKFGVIERVIENELADEYVYVAGLLVISYRDNSCPDVLYRLSVHEPELQKFIDGAYPLGSDEFEHGVLEARNTKTDEWVAGKMPRLDRFLFVSAKHVAHGAFAIKLVHVDGWKCYAALSRKELSDVVMMVSKSWRNTLKFIYKIEAPNGTLIRNSDPMRYRRNAHLLTAGGKP